MDAVILSSSFALLAAVALLLARLGDQRLVLFFCGLCAVYFGLDHFVTSLPRAFDALFLIGERWNWTGKVFSLSLAGLVIVACGLAPATIGLTFKQRHVNCGLIGLVLVTAWGVALGVVERPGALDMETLAFQATMPGLAEELVYRGIVPALLFGLIQRRQFIEGIPWAVILATSAIFGAWHGLKFSHGQFDFAFMPALNSGLFGVAIGWLRFKTGSLVVPVLAHNFYNVAFRIAGA